MLLAPSRLEESMYLLNDSCLNDNANALGGDISYINSFIIVKASFKMKAVLHFQVELAGKYICCQLYQD